MFDHLVNLITIHLIIGLVILGILQGSPCSGQVQDEALTFSNLTVINDDIDVSINIVPTKQSFTTTYVPANIHLNVTAIHGPGHNESLLSYEWSTKEGPIKIDKHAKTFQYQFTKSNEDNFIQVNVSDPSTNSSAVAKVDVTVKSQVVVADPVGKLFLEKGEMLDINLIYAGSGPFTYCYKFCEPYDFLPCNLCFPPSETSETKIHIRHYLHNVGNYTLMFRIENIMNKEERQYAIKINDTVRKSNLPVAPIVSSILAVCILITGVGLHIRFKDTPYNTETANFDFFRDDDEEWEREFSFIQRVRYLFCGAQADDFEDENESRHLIQKRDPNPTPGSDPRRYDH